jgi:endoglucanase
MALDRIGSCYICCMKRKVVFIFITAVLLINCTRKAQIADIDCGPYQCILGGIVRGDTAKRELSVVVTGGDFADGGEYIRKVLDAQEVKASFFFTGDFYRNPDFKSLIEKLKRDGHYLGAHSDKHLLYCAWENRDSLLVSKDLFLSDLKANYDEMARFGIGKAQYFLPPYEWYNDSIGHWTREAGLQLINFTPGTRSNADYTTPNMSSYRSSEEIYRSIVDFEASSPRGLNGFILLIHIGTAPERTDKFYHRLDELFDWLKEKGYELKRIDELLLSG